MSNRNSHGRRERPRHISDDDDDDVEHGKRARVNYTDYDEQVAKEKLEDLIVQLGNNSSIEQHETVQNDVHDLSVVLECEIGKFKDAIIRVLVACASERPDKLRVYATLIGLLNLKNHAFVGEFLERLVMELRSDLQSADGTDWDCVLCMVRFLAELTNYRVVSPASLMQLYNAFVGVTLEEGIPQARSDCFVHLVLASLPWAAGTLAEKHRAELTQLLASVGSYRARRSLAHLATVQSLAGQEDWIDSLWHQIQSLAKSDWREKVTVRYEAFAGMLASADAVPHSLPAMAPQPHDDSCSDYPPPRAVFRLFDYTDVPEDGPALPGEHAVERYLVEEHLSALIACNHHDRKDCAKTLLNARFGVRVPVPYVLAELALGQMLKMPCADRLQLFYGSLLIELCKEDPETMPNVVAQATFGLFDRLDAMNAECADRLARWFSYHLSQCKYQWSWADWAEECQTLPYAHPKMVFLRDTAQLLVRFSFFDQIRKMLGPQLAPLLLHPRQPECTYKYDNESEHSKDMVACAHRLIDAIRERCTPDKAIEVLNGVPKPVVEEPASDGDPADAHMLLKVDLFFSTLLYLGSKTFSHSFAALAKFHPVCRALVPPESGRAKARLLATLYECWHWHEQMMVVLLDKLVKVQLVDCLAVFHWLFGPVLGWAGLPLRELSRGYAWDAAASTLAKMCKQRARLREDCAKAKRQYDSYHERMRESAAAAAAVAAAAAAAPADGAAATAANAGQGQQAAPMDEDEDPPTRDELEAKQAKLDKAVAELKALAECLLRCAVWGAQPIADGGSSGDNGFEDGDASVYLKKLVWDRSLAVLTMHYSDVKQVMRDLRATHHHQLGKDAEKFFAAFSSLSD